MRAVVPELFFAPCPDEPGRIGCWEAVVRPGSSSPIAFSSVESDRQRRYEPGDEGYDELLEAYREEYSDSLDHDQPSLQI